MKALVVGLGSIGVRHLNNLYSLGVRELGAVRTRNLPPPREIIPKDVTFFQDLDFALSQKFNLVIVANPTSFHLETLVKALKAGSNVYVEKPLAHERQYLTELTPYLISTEPKVLVGCQLRMHPGLQKIEEWINESKLGKIYSVQVDLGEYLPDWHPWEDYRQSYAARADQGGGVILTLIHELDYLHWLFGKPKNVYAIGGHRTSLEVTVEDTALITLETERGICIQLRMDYWRKPPTRHMNIVAEKGIVDWDYHTRLTTLKQNGKILDQIELPPTWDRNELFLSMMREFLEGLSKGSTPRVTLQDGIDVLQTALTAKESIQIHRKDFL
ncbi:Gfo/Idh/MocA family oxidoreductase [Nitrosomonas sp. Is37]|uniref:Gfo/Idh/MocA family protein n=1 Tax=Nitrosomonas sp. Is37 TaxID=3080535 RepID=UPI00294B3FAE|nr:Gfo/Idh/MocA family oxidoreductase [Nitrosomonas sp. Is37]MDV6345520.1 Gfo/Idh/MocA family oxidoreductase [Nitrosomonas sp. Is37]